MRAEAELSGIDPIRNLGVGLDTQLHRILTKEK